MASGAGFFHWRGSEKVVPADQATANRLGQGQMAIRTGRVARSAISLPHRVERVKILFSAALAQRFCHPVQGAMQAGFISFCDIGVTGRTGRIGVGLIGVGSFKICRSVITAMATDTADGAMQALWELRAHEGIQKRRP